MTSRTDEEIEPSLFQPHPGKVPAVIEKWSRKVFVGVATAMTLAVAGLAVLSPWFLLLALPVGLFWFVGVGDMIQRRHSIRRNFPVIGHIRYFLESLRPELRQYFVESELEENPISREKRSIVYQRAKNQLDTLPFGTRHDLYRNGYEWINHSLAARAAPEEEKRIRIGEDQAEQPYDASVLNISAMSYGSLSKNAILALNLGARRGGFFHNTGEGGISPHHLKYGGDLVWQIGTGYFGCRTRDGRFDTGAYEENARRPSVKMIELKLSQGAKPGHGGILPAGKVTEEIAAIRGVPLGQDVISPPAHSAFSSPVEMMQFIQRLREHSGGKPVGIKLCVGPKREFLAVCKAMLETGIRPDFIAVDGGEGGTGAAPLEFSNSVGTPLTDGLAFVHNALTGAGVRQKIKVIASGKVTTGFHVISRLALGADLCNTARSMMFAVGCIQAVKCNTNTCPVGVATQDPDLVKGLDVDDKARRVRQYHRSTVKSVYELLGAAGLDDPAELEPRLIFRRVGEGDVRSYAQLFPCVDEGAFLDGSAPERLQEAWGHARADVFRRG